MTGVLSPEAPSPEARSASAVRLVAVDRRLLGELYDQYGQLAYSLALSITHHRETAERIVTAAFAATWRRLERNEIARSSFFVTLMATGRAEAISQRLQARSEVIATAFAPSEDAPIASGFTTDVVNALGALPEAQRRILALAYFGGLAVGDIASELQEPMKDVKENLQAAMRQLRSALSHGGGGGVPV